jgi:adenylate cyclase
MLARLRDWLFEGRGPEHLPDRVSETIRLQQENSEILIGWAELVLVGLLAIAYETTTMAEGVVQEDYSFETEVFIFYGLFTVIRLVLAYRRALPEWLLYVSVVVDMALLMGLIYSFHLKYAQTAVFYLKAPTLFYVFLFIALRALRFEARFVIFTGLCAAVGWIALILYALSERGGPPNRTMDFVEYMTSNSFLIQAEADKLLAIVLTTAVLAIAITRARNLLIRAVTEGTTAPNEARMPSPRNLSMLPPLAAISGHTRP